MHRTAAGLIQRLIQRLGRFRQGIHRDGARYLFAAQIILRQELFPQGVQVGGVMEQEFPLVR